jgi:hypothetical protein
VKLSLDSRLESRGWKLHVSKIRDKAKSWTMPRSIGTVKYDSEVELKEQTRKSWSEAEW